MGMEEGMPVMETPKRKLIKCIVWDLDNTLWKGILSEDETVELKEGVESILCQLDQRGILHSIASRNDYDKAWEKLQELNLSEYFLCPQINWGSKAESITQIAKTLDIGLDSIAFIDDQSAELEEVRFSHPHVLCIDAVNLENLAEMPEMNPSFLTVESKNRRLMYRGNIERESAEKEFVGPKEEFLASLKMTFVISSAQESDLKRAEELTLRTNQLNTTGYTYSYQELRGFTQSERHRFFVAGLEDKFGSYGKIGLSLIETRDDVWMIKLLLMSCRVISRGVGTILLHHIMKLAKKNNARLLAEFIPNNRNRMMLVTYKFAGFKELKKTGELMFLEADLEKIPDFPLYIDVRIY